MSSPFAAFRKNQKMLMAVLGVMVMVAFLILPPLIDYDWNAMVGSEEFVSTRYGVLTEMDLNKLRKRRTLANQFINAARMKANLPQFEIVFGEPNDANVVETMLLVKKAEEAGIEIPDDRVVDLLNRLTEDRVDAAGVSEIAKRLFSQESEIMDALRYEMMAQQYRELQYPGVQIGTPLDRWNQYQSLNREVSVEVIPLPVDSYMVKVKDPTDAQLREFFDKYKDTETTVKTGEPGFKQPERAAFQYFRVKLSDFVSQVTVTDEEIAAAYERDKDRLYPYIPDPQTIRNPFVDENTNPSGVPTDETSPPIDEPVAPATGGEVPATETPAADATPEAATPETKAPEAATPDAAPTETPPAEKPADAPQSSVRRSPFHLASYRLQDSPPEEEAAAATDAPPPVNQTAPVASDTATPTADTQGTTIAPAAATPGTEEAPLPAGDTATANESPSSIIDEPLVPQELIPPFDLQNLPRTLPPPPRYEPLSAVREQIRQGLAEEKALPLMEKVIGDLSREMRKYEGQYRGWLSLQKQNPKAEPPKPLNFDDLARKYGVEAQQTPLLARDALFFSDKYTLGKSYIGATMTQQAMVYLAGFTGKQLYQVQESQDPQGDKYLFWRTEEKASYEPTFEEVRGEVLDAWKREEAKKLVLDEAQKLATQAREAKKSLREAFADRADLPVTAPRPFTWKYQRRSSVQPIGLSTVEGLPDVGDEFMKVVYELQVGQVGVAMDIPKSTVYLIRLENTAPDLNILHTLFLMTDYSNYVSAGIDQAQQRQNNWLQELNTQAEVQWLRAPRGM